MSHAKCGTAFALNPEPPEFLAMAGDLTNRAAASMFEVLALQRASSVQPNTSRVSKERSFE